MFKEHRAVLSRFYSCSQGLNVNTFTVKNMSSSIRKDPKKASQPKYDSSYHNGQVFAFFALLLEHLVDNPEYGPQFVLNMVTLAFIHSLSADLACRGADLFDVTLNPDRIILYRRGAQVSFLTKVVHDDANPNEGDSTPGEPEAPKVTYTPDPAKIRSCDSGDFILTGGKTTKGGKRHRVRVTKTRRCRVKNHKYCDSFELLALYCELTQSIRDLMAIECQQLFVVARICNRRCNPKKGYTPPCGGLCGFHHPMPPTSLNNTRKAALKMAGIDTSKYTSHAIRGNSENAIIAASFESDRFTAEEAWKRSGHGYGTYEKHYKRPADSLYVYELKQYGHKRDLTPEEAIRIGGLKAARAAFDKQMPLKQAK